ncbi:MAG: galactose mutarotase [Sphingobium sp.]|nr:galactose mutarotase [Sphingobium sp.]
MRHKSTLLLLASTLAASPALAAPTATKALFGTARDGAQVDLVTLRNDKGMVVKFSTRGGTITEISVPDRKGKMGNVILGVTGFEAWEKMIGFNAITGRYANRIGNGGFTLDGTFYKLPTNPKGVILHGGFQGLSGKIFAAETFAKDGRAGATLILTSPDGENGFPGALTLHVTYSLGNDNVLRLEFEATTTKPTVVNLTNHAYFTLGTHASGPIYNQLLQVFASRWTPTDENQVPTGELRSVAGTPFDFRKARPMLPAIYSTDPQVMLAKGLDHNLVLDGPSGGKPRLALRLTDPGSGRQLEVRTTEPAVQLYSTNGAGGTDAGDGMTIRQSDGLAIETENFPDAPNKPNFPSSVLRPGETFRSVTEFAFTTDKEPFPK